VKETVGYTWADYKTNTEIAKELHITPVLDKIQELPHVQHAEDTRGDH
jgi:hypothetical protein